MAGELAGLGARLTSIVDPAAQGRIVRAAGMAAKRAALDAAARDVGPERTFSGFKRKVRLNVGFDPIGHTKIELKLRPAGLWALAERGRRGTKRVAVGGRGRRRIGPMVTPYGVKSAFTSKPSRGLNTIDHAVRAGVRDSGRAADRQVQGEIRKALRG